MIRFVTILGFSLLVSAPVQAEKLTVVGTPAVMSKATREAVYDSVMAIISHAKQGDKIHVYDASKGQRVVAMAVKRGNSARSKINRMRKEYATFQAYLKRAASTRSADKEQINVPQFLETIGSSLRQGAETTQVLLFGLPAYLEERDQGFTFSKGVVPNDRYISASSMQSVFGTSDREGALNQVVVHFCIQDRFVNQRERRAVTRFWVLYVRALGGTLSTFEQDPAVTLERLIEGASDPLLPRAKLDRDVRDFIMVDYSQGLQKADKKSGKEVGNGKAAVPSPKKEVPELPETPAPEKPKPAPLPLPKPPRESVFVIDWSGSMSNNVPAIQAGIKAILVNAPQSDRVGLILFSRKHGLLTRPLCTVAEARARKDWLPAQEGSIHGDPEAATHAAIKLFSPKSAVRDLIVIGDNASELSDRLESNTRWLKSVQDFVRASSTNRVAMVFCGTEEVQRSVYQRIAEATPGGKGRFEEGLDDLSSILRRMDN